MDFQENYFDVIVVGAGPAGSSCAKTLSENGVSVLVIDKKNFPRIKSCCGFLTNRAIDFIEENFGVIPERIFCKNRKINFLWSSTGINYNQVNGYDAFTNVYRDHFGQLKKKYNFELELVRDERCCVEHQLGTNKKFLGKGSVLFAGEAAGLMENWGIGITAALISGNNAALAILQGNDICNNYSKLMEKEIAFIDGTYR